MATHGPGDGTRRTSIEGERIAPEGLLVGGGVTMLAGLVLMAFPITVSVAVTLFTGWCMMVGGAALIGAAIVGHSGRPLAATVTLGALMLLAGYLLATNVIAGVVTLTAIVTTWLLVDGVLGIAAALLTRVPGFGLLLASSVFGVVLGALLWADWPVSDTWLIGLYVGIVLFLRGGSLLDAGLQQRGGTR